MDDKKFIYTIGICALGLLMWHYKSRYNSDNTATPTPVPGYISPAAISAGLPVYATDPIDQLYSADPDLTDPTTPANLAINIANQSANLLDQQYTPLFGFVGVADNQLWQ